MRRFSTMYRMHRKKPIKISPQQSLWQNLHATKYQIALKTSLIKSKIPVAFVIHALFRYHLSFGLNPNTECQFNQFLPCQASIPPSPAGTSPSSGPPRCNLSPLSHPHRWPQHCSHHLSAIAITQCKHIAIATLSSQMIIRKKPMCISAFLECGWVMCLYYKPYKPDWSLL